MLFIKKIITLFTVLILIFTVTSCKRLPENSEIAQNKVDESVSLPATETENTEQNNQSVETEKETPLNTQTETDEQTEDEPDTQTDGPQEGDIVESVNQSFIYSSIADKINDADVIAIVTYGGESTNVIPDGTANEIDKTRVFTDQKVTVERYIKGEGENELFIRRIGGRSTQTYMVSNDPQLEKDGRYLVFLNCADAVKENDITAYTVHSGYAGCYLIDENSINTDGLSDEDAQKLNELFE